MIQCQVEIVRSCRDRLNDLEELIYSMGPERVNVPSKIEQLSFLTSKTYPSTVFGSLVRKFSWRSERVPTSVPTLTNLCTFTLWFFSPWTKLETNHQIFTGTTLERLGDSGHTGVRKHRTQSSIPWAIVNDKHCGLRPLWSSPRTRRQLMTREVSDGKVQPKSWPLLFSVVILYVLCCSRYL